MGDKIWLSEQNCEQPLAGKTTQMSDPKNTASRLQTASSVAEFIEWIANLKPAVDGDLYAYRGERNKNWKLKPGLLRDDKKKLLDNERDAVRELISVRPHEFLDDKTMFDRLVRMQHFGLPTRLLDVTANPLVALYNATGESGDKSEPATDGKVMYFRVPKAKKKYFDSDTVSCLANLANLSGHEKQEIFDNTHLSSSEFNNKGIKSVSRLLQLIRAEKPYFLPEIIPSDFDTLWYVVPKLSNPRIIAQRGAFIIFGFLRSTGATVNNQDPIKTNFIEVQASKKAEIRKQLDALGINKSGLFPEIDRAAEYVVDQLA